jgi:exoribonuclease R
MTHQILVTDRTYLQYSISEVGTGQPADLPNIDPFSNKLFTMDLFNIKHDCGVELVKSPIRGLDCIAGVLFLEDSNTYGRTANKKRLLYKCIPDDSQYPPFLIPYDPVLGFSKVLKNKYVLFKYDNWNTKYPHGILVNVLGDVDNLEVFYEYQLYCKSLHDSITQFTNKTHNKLKKKTASEYITQIRNNPVFNIQDRRTTHTVFTIDPLHSLDFDDGFSIQLLPTGNYIMSVYIANVFVWLETLCLWNTFSKRVSTIYLPDKRRPMLPNILSDTLCSLQQDQDRFAYVMDVEITENGEPLFDSIRFSNVVINVKKNYVYEDPELLTNDINYARLFDISRKMDRTILDSHDVVAYWMIFMNTQCGEYMANNGFGIFRSFKYINKNTEPIAGDFNENTRRVIKSWNNSCGQYMLYDNIENHGHELMNIKSYVHATSPIRRLVDLLNHMMMFRHQGLVTSYSADASNFMEEWSSNIDTINALMRSIRKVQTNCDVLHRCVTDSTILQKTYRGVIFDKALKRDDLYTYMVYLEDIQLLSKLSCRKELSNYSTANFQLYLFHDENNVKKKIRLHIIDEEVV